MDAELKSCLDGFESRVSSHIDVAFAESEQRLRSHVDQVVSQSEDRLRSHVDQVVSQSEDRLRSHVDQVVSQSEDRSRAHTELVETRLLTEFWKWARTADARYRQHQAIVGGLDIRVQTIEDRLSDLEQRLAS